MPQRPRICLIDDDAMVRDALSLGLSDSGFDVVAAGDAASALALIGDEHFDAAVTDMTMPAASGADLIAALHAAKPALPIVAISGAQQIGGRDLADVARGVGAAACLVKPFRTRELAALLTRLVQNSP
ncbi:MAG TPA: response regulator [Caulobacterales bacterium]|nr:response regulator [Caulobacterales bacterium]